MKNKFWKYDYISVGNKSYQFIDGKLKWIVKWGE